MKRKKIVIGIIALAVICILPTVAEILRGNEESVAAVKLPKEERLAIVIDPGHGGFDGGAVSTSGIEEKTINLSIAIKLRDIIESRGHTVIMTREKDQGLCGFEKDTIAGKKNKDMKERKRIIEETNPDLTISVHLNSFPQDKSVHGAQCFYPVETSSEVSKTSKAIAKNIQDALERNIDDGKKREAMEKKDLFLFTDSKKPIVIVECGFLSNDDEEKALKSPKNQQLIAESIWEGIEKSRDLMAKTGLE